jgi:hypothetical protein
MAVDHDNAGVGEPEVENLHGSGALAGREIAYDAIR